jgi:hypothetical protein
MKPTLVLIAILTVLVSTGCVSPVSGLYSADEKRISVGSVAPARAEDAWDSVIREGMHQEGASSRAEIQHEDTLRRRTRFFVELGLGVGYFSVGESHIDFDARPPNTLRPDFRAGSAQAPGWGSTGTGS